LKFLAKRKVQIFDGKMQRGVSWTARFWFGTDRERRVQDELAWNQLNLDVFNN
jgi:hypothetical protein